MQNERDVVEWRGCLHQHLREWSRDHADHFPITWVGDRLHLADHADDRKPRTRPVESTPTDALADRRLVRPKAFRDALTDDANERCVGAIALEEIATLQQGLAGALEVSGHGHTRVCRVNASWLRSGCTFRVE